MSLAEEIYQALGLLNRLIDSLRHKRVALPGNSETLKPVH